MIQLFLVFFFVRRRQLQQWLPCFPLNFREIFPPFPLITRSPTARVPHFKFTFLTISPAPRRVSSRCAETNQPPDFMVSIFLWVAGWRPKGWNFLLHKTTPTQGDIGSQASLGEEFSICVSIVGEILGVKFTAAHRIQKGRELSWFFFYFLYWIGVFSVSFFLGWLICLFCVLVAIRYCGLIVV